MKKKPDVKIIASADDDVPPEILARAIVNLSEAAAKLLRSGLNRRAMLVLLKDSSGVSHHDINLVLDALVDLRKNYCK